MNINQIKARSEKIRAKSERQTESTEDIARIQGRFSTHPSSGLTPARAAQILKEAEQGSLVAQCQLAEDMEEKDTHIFAELSKRRRAVSGLRFNIRPPINASREEIRDTDMIREIIDSFMWLDECIFDMTDAILKGFSCNEFTGWERQGSLHVPSGYEWIDPSTFQLKPNTKNVLHLSNGSYEGVPLQPFNWITHIAKSKSGTLSRVGLVRTLVWPYIFKNYSLRDFAEFLEIYALPIRIGKFSSGATEKEKAALLRAVMAIGHNAGGIIPAGMEIIFQSAAEGSSDPFLNMNELMEKLESKAILGGTLTSQADGATSTNALGDVHNDVRNEVCIHDAKGTARTLTRDLIFPLYAINARSFSSPDRFPRLEFDFTEPEDISTFATALPSLVNIGMKIPAAWVHEKLQIPVAESDEAVLQVATQPAYLNATVSAQPFSGVAALTAQSAQVDPIKAMPAAVSGQDWQQTIDPILKPVIEIIQTTDLVTARAKIEALYDQLDSEQLEDLIARGLFVAQLWGRLNG